MKTLLAVYFMHQNGGYYVVEVTEVSSVQIAVSLAPVSDPHLSEVDEKTQEEIRQKLAKYASFLEDRIEKNFRWFSECPYGQGFRNKINFCSAVEYSAKQLAAISEALLGGSHYLGK
jgi:hypothetical protein